MNKKAVYFFGNYGIGDDMMFVWAYLAGVQTGFVKPGERFYFSNPASTAFMQFLNSEFHEIKPETSLHDGSGLIACRGIGLKDRSRRKWTALFSRLFFSKLPVRLTSYHKEVSVYRADVKFAGIIEFLKRCGIFYAWNPGYPLIYDGWQELCATRCVKKEVCERDAHGLSAGYVQIRDRALNLVKHAQPENDVILFPSGGSAQNFDDEFTALLKDGLPVKIARFAEDKKSADIYYPDLKSAALIMAGARGVITNDSAASHAAQFFAKNHLLICSRSRPENVVFLGAKTEVFDLGDKLSCRPCHYTPGNEINCAAGFRTCKAFHGADKQTVKQISEIIARW